MLLNLEITITCLILRGFLLLITYKAGGLVATSIYLRYLLYDVRPPQDVAWMPLLAQSSSAIAMAAASLGFMRSLTSLSAFS